MKYHLQRSGFAAIIALVALAGAGMTPAKAQDTGKLNMGWLFGYETVNLAYNPTGGPPSGFPDNGQETGIFKSTLTVSPSNTFGLTDGTVINVCNEITQDIFLGTDYNYTILPLTNSNFPAPYNLQNPPEGAVAGNPQAGEIGSVINDFLNVASVKAGSGVETTTGAGSLTLSSDSNMESEWSAAAQIAVWDLSYDTVTNGTIASDAPLQVTSSNAGGQAAIADANLILQYENGRSDLNDAVWFNSGPPSNPSGGNQDQLVPITGGLQTHLATLPEPGFVQLAMLLGLGGLGYLRKRRGTGMRPGLALAI